MKEFFIATSNKGKIIEIRECLADLDITLLAPEDLAEKPAQPLETENTFEGNALQKAQYYQRITGLPVIADDSGILVHALADELGIHTRRWGAGSKANDEEWISFFLERMKHENDKRAQFVCVIAFIDSDGIEHTFHGFCDGIITETLEADYLPGLPISACFKPEGFEKVYSGLSIEEKNRISHRGKAVEQLKNFLRKN